MPTLEEYAESFPPDLFPWVHEAAEQEKQERATEVERLAEVTQKDERR
jgi:hypothetical protein